MPSHGTVLGGAVLLHSAYLIRDSGGMLFFHVSENIVSVSLYAIVAFSFRLKQKKGNMH